MNSFTCQKIENILFQILEVLDYLHPEVAHQDLKPENIAVEYYYLSISIRIADFGLAKVSEGTNLRTDCEINYYMASELYEGQKYIDSVDLQSAGLIVLKYTYRLPVKLAWKTYCQDIANYANKMDGESDPLLKILQTGMLKMKPREKLSAYEYLKRAKTDFLSMSPLILEELCEQRKKFFGGEIANRKSIITVMAGVLKSQKPAHLSKTILLRTAVQDNVADDNGSPPHQGQEILLGRQETSNLDDDGNLEKWP